MHNHPRRMHSVLDTWIDIEAQPRVVWDMLVDFKAWKLWNPFIPVVEGKFQVGEVLRIEVVPPGLKSMTFKPEVFVIKPYEKIIWGGSFLWIVYRGEHSFILEPLVEGKTRFRQIEIFRGPMVLFMSNMIKNTEIGYHRMNQEFKRYVEGNLKLY